MIIHFEVKSYFAKCKDHRLNGVIAYYYFITVIDGLLFRLGRDKSKVIEKKCGKFGWSL